MGEHTELSNEITRKCAACWWPGQVGVSCCPSSGIILAVLGAFCCSGKRWWRKLGECELAGSASSVCSTLIPCPTQHWGLATGEAQR